MAGEAMKVRHALIMPAEDGIRAAIEHRLGHYLHTRLIADGIIRLPPRPPQRADAVLR